jgi:hypothetical protein
VRRRNVTQCAARSRAGVSKYTASKDCDGNRSTPCDKGQPVERGRGRRLSNLEFSLDLQVPRSCHCTARRAFHRRASFPFGVDTSVGGRLTAIPPMNPRCETANFTGVNYLGPQRVPLLALVLIMGGRLCQGQSSTSPADAPKVHPRGFMWASSAVSRVSDTQG